VEYSWEETLVRVWELLGEKSKGLSVALFKPLFAHESLQLTQPITTTLVCSLDYSFWEIFNGHGLISFTF
jgi:hypothetical protein